MGVDGCMMPVADGAAGASVDSAVLARRACGAGWGVMSTVHRSGPVGLRLLRRTVVPWASVVVRPVFEGGHAIGIA